MEWISIIILAFIIVLVCKRIKFKKKPIRISKEKPIGISAEKAKILMNCSKAKNNETRHTEYIISLINEDISEAALH
jgi:hypothetical protein